jgi:8-oxo-dGTP pyrophosphatase MutT (NUDIX family)
MIDIISETDLLMVEKVWPFAQEKRAEIAAHWTECVGRNPSLWDGRMLGTLNPRFEGGVFSAQMLETSFSAFLAWRDWGFPDTGYFNLFGSAVIAGSDGGCIFGVMGSHTSNAGAIYPCGGSLEPADVGSDGKVNLWKSIARELAEETGLSADEARLGETFLVRSGQLLSVSRVFHFDMPTDDLARRIKDNIAAQSDPELASVVVLRRLADLDFERAKPYAIATAQYFLEE